jgi:hypothetical protein
VLDPAHRLVVAADDFLLDHRLGRDGAESTSQSYAVCSSRICFSTARSDRAYRVAMTFMTALRPLIESSMAHAEAAHTAPADTPLRGHSQMILRIPLRGHL